MLIATNPLVNSRQLIGFRIQNENTACLISGSINADIAQRRSSSEYTIANQVQSIFRKLSVRSREELVVKLQTKES